MITVYWYEYGVRVCKGDHIDNGAYNSGEDLIAYREFDSVDDALQTLQTSNRAFEMLKLFKHLEE